VHFGGFFNIHFLYLYIYIYIYVCFNMFQTGQPLSLGDMSGISDTSISAWLGLDKGGATQATAVTTTPTTTPAAATTTQTQFRSQSQSQISDQPASEESSSESTEIK